MSPVALGTTTRGSQTMSKSFVYLFVGTSLLEVLDDQVIRRLLHVVNYIPPSQPDPFQHAVHPALETEGRKVPEEMIGRRGG